MSGAAVSSKSEAERALQQQIRAVWRTLQDTRSNLSVCDSLVRQVVKPAPAVASTVSRQTYETYVQTDVRSTTVAGIQCARAIMESRGCLAAPEQCSQSVQTEEFAPNVDKHCQAVTDVTASAVQTAEAGASADDPLLLNVEPECDVTAGPVEVEALSLVESSANSAPVPHREYHRLKRKTDVLKRKLRAERAKNVRALSGDSAYRLSALRLATLALSIQETYQEMLLDLGSLLQQLAALVSNTPVPITLPPPEGVGGWYRQVRELAAATLRCVIENQTEISEVRSKVIEVDSQELSSVGTTQHDTHFGTLATAEHHSAQLQMTHHIHSHTLYDPGRLQSSPSTVTPRQKSSPSADVSNDQSTVSRGRRPSRAAPPQTLTCSSHKSTPREVLTESDGTIPHEPQTINVHTAGHAAEVRKCSQSHQMCDSDLGPCLKAKGHGDEARWRGVTDSSSDGEDAIDIACCSHTCHHHTYLKTFVESQKRAPVQRDTKGGFGVSSITVDNSGSPEVDHSTVAPNAREALHSSTHIHAGCKKMRKDVRSRNSAPVNAEAGQELADDGIQCEVNKMSIRSDIRRSSTSGEKEHKSTKCSQRELTAQQSGSRQASHDPSRGGRRPVTDNSTESFCSTPFLTARKLPEHLRDEVEVIEKCPTSSDYTETISSSVTASRTSYNSASSSSVPKTKLRSRRAIRPATSSGTDTLQTSESAKGVEVSQGGGSGRSERACDDSATPTLTPPSGSPSARQGIHLRFVEILDELKEKLLHCDE